MTVAKGNRVQEQHLDKGTMPKETKNYFIVSTPFLQSECKHGCVKLVVEKNSKKNPNLHLAIYKILHIYSFPGSIVREVSP